MHNLLLFWYCKKTTHRLTNTPLPVVASFLWLCMYFLYPAAQNVFPAVTSVLVSKSAWKDCFSLWLFQSSFQNMPEKIAFTHGKKVVLLISTKIILHKREIKLKIGQRFFCEAAHWTRKQVSNCNLHNQSADLFKKVKRTGNKSGAKYICYSFFFKTPWSAILDDFALTLHIHVKDKRQKVLFFSLLSSDQIFYIIAINISHFLFFFQLNIKSKKLSLQKGKMPNLNILKEHICIQNIRGMQHACIKTWIQSAKCKSFLKIRIAPVMFTKRNEWHWWICNISIVNMLKILPEKQMMFLMTRAE